MARRSFTDFGRWLSIVVKVWPQFGSDFTLGDEDVNTLRTRSTDYHANLSRINQLEGELRVLKSQRDMDCRWMTSFSVRLRSALLGQFGQGSREMSAMPVLLKHRPGRPNKAAAARKAKTLERRAQQEQSS